MTKWGRGANAAAATGSSAARAFRNIAGPGNGKWPIQIYFEWCLHGHHSQSPSECSSVTCNLESSYLKSCQFDLHIFYNRLWCEPWAYLQISRPCLVVAGQNAASEGKWFGCPGWRLGFPRLWQTLRKTSHHTADPRGCLPSPDFMVSNYCIILPGGKKMSSSPRMGWNISSQSTAIFKSIRKGAEAICSMAFRINCCLSWNTRCSENKMQSTWLRLDGIKWDPCQSVLMQCNWDTTDGGICPGWGECPLATRTQAGAMLPEWMSAISVTLSHAWHNMKPRPKQIVFCAQLVRIWDWILNLPRQLSNFQCVFTKTSISWFHGFTIVKGAISKMAHSGRCSYGTVSASTSEIADAKCPRIAHFASIALQPLAFETASARSPVEGFQEMSWVSS